MWRLCDLHRHTFADDRAVGDVDPAKFVAECLAEGLTVVAVTDHNLTTNIEAVVSEAATSGLAVIPGVEVDTDRGHVLALAPDPADGLGVLREFCLRLGLVPNQQRPYSELIAVHGATRPNGLRYADSIILVGAHVDQPGSLLVGNQTHDLADQLAAAGNLQALEVARAEILAQWSSPAGVKNSGRSFTLIRGTDSHPDGTAAPLRSTWLYLPNVTANALRHALATPESSIRFDQQAPRATRLWIKSVSIEGGPYAGLHLEFDPRSNALIGPPSSGKSLVIDSIRWALDSRCLIPDVATACEARLRHCLPEGASVTVSLVADGTVTEITRVRGGGAVSQPPFLPIAFSQTELTRRAMETRPSIELLDIHTPDAAIHKNRINQLQAAAAIAMQALVTHATSAASLRAAIDNPQDGLSATNAELTKLAGTEPVTKMATDLGRIDLWRKNVQTALEAWRTQPPIQLPPLPPLPTLESITDAATVTPRPAIAAILAELRTAIDQAVAAAQVRAEAALTDSLPAVEAVKKRIEEELARLGLASAAALSQRVATLRSRLATLEESSRQLATLDEQVANSLAELHDIIDAADSERLALLTLRKNTCSLLNSSMRSFFVLINEYADALALDAVIDDLKVGTNLQQGSLRQVRDTLDRKRIVDRMAAQLSGKLWAPAAPVAQSMVDQDSIVSEATTRGKYPLLAMVITNRPDDTLGLLQRAATGAPIPFHELTEGLRALAIKEISFAASDLPAISDQPEDAVPTTAVFDSLVPTIRTQRADRQFIFASHDANIVVAGDVERVTVLSPVPGTLPTSGTLFERQLRSSAMDLLEGGEHAFRLRQTRYGS